MKKLIISSIISAISFSASAKMPSKDHWENDGESSATIASIKAKNHSFANLMVSDSGISNIYFYVNNDSCEGKTEPKEAGNMKIDGQYVSVAYVCAYKNIAKIFPYSKAGVDYMTNEFKHKNMINITFANNNYSFSGKGFTKEYNRIYIEAVKQQNAL